MVTYCIAPITGPHWTRGRSLPPAESAFNQPSKANGRICLQVAINRTQLSPISRTLRRQIRTSPGPTFPFAPARGARRSGLNRVQTARTGKMPCFAVGCVFARQNRRKCREAEAACQRIPEEQPTRWYSNRRPDIATIAARSASVGSVWAAGDQLRFSSAMNRTHFAWLSISLYRIDDIPKNLQN